MTITFIIATVFGYYAIFDQEALKTKTAFYLVGMFLPVIAGLYVCFFFFGNKGELSNTRLFALSSIGLMVVLGLAYLYHSQSLRRFSKLTSMSYLLMAFMAIVGLALFYSIGKKSVDEMQTEVSITGFVLKFLFFLPCMLFDLVRYLVNDVRNTSALVFILFITELVLIILFLSMPYIQNAYLTMNSTFLLPGAQFLKQKQIISNSMPMRMEEYRAIDTKYDIDTNTNFRRNYALSMWIYINDYDKSTKHQTKQIFQYGNGEENGGNPRVEYQNDELVVTLSNRPSQQSVLKRFIPKQKWVFLVFNYQHNDADLFVNGELVHSVKFTDDLPVYNEFDVVTLGDEDRSVGGSICNVVYYKQPLSLADIVSQYNLLMFSNPPVYSTFLMSKGIPGVKDLK
jgi:hypothetical protein